MHIISQTGGCKSDVQNYGEIVAENSVKYVSPDGFLCIQILPNSILAWALPQNQLWKLMTPSNTLVGWGAGYPLATYWARIKYQKFSVADGRNYRNFSNNINV